MFVNFNILNQLGSPAINSNTFANRPAAGQSGRLFVSTDTFEIYRDNGTTWDLIGGPGSSTITGTGTATQVAYFTSSQAIGSSANLYWDNTSGFLGVGSNAPSARIEAVKTDGIGIYANYTTNAGSGSSATAIWAKNVTNSSGYGAVIEETTPNATAGQYPLLIKHSLSSGTAGVGMGTGVHWQLPDDAGTFKTTQLTVETIDAAAATYKTRYRFNVQNNGSSLPVAYINSTGLGIFTATPGAALDIHSTGTIAQLNSTGTTNNGYLAFQRTGATTFSIGDTYNGGSNYFRIFGSALSADIVRIFAATGESSFTSTETYSSGNSIGVAVQHNLTIPNAVNVGLAAIGGVNSNLNLTLGGSTTVANTGRQGLEGSTTINFTGAGTLTMTQGSTVRAFSAISSVYAFNGSAVGTITHLAGLRICFPDNVGSAVNITNNYALLINNQTTGTGTVTYTNRWGIYQEGASDLNYMAANLLLGSTVNTGEKLQVTGTAVISSSLTANNFVASGGNNTTVFNSSNATTGWVQIAMNNTTGSALLGVEGIAAGTLATGTTAYATVLRNYTATDLQIATNNIVRTTITSGGNVGIGTTSPAQLLSVEGSTTEVLSVGTSAQKLYFRPDSGGVMLSTATGQAGEGIYFGNSSDFMYFQTASTERMRITSGGTTQIKKGDSNDALTIYGSGANSYIFFKSTSSFATIGSITAGVGYLPISVEGSNVLIGTTTDTGYKLNVNGFVFSNSFKSTGGLFDPTAGNNWINAAFATITNASPYGGGIALLDGTAGFCTWLDGAGANFRIGYATTSTNPTSQFLLTSAGNVAVAGSIQTGTPSGGTTGAWKLGSYKAATVVLNTANYIEVDIGGTLYKLAVVT